MPPAGIVGVRGLEDQAEITKFFEIIYQALYPENPAEGVPTGAANWRDEVLNDPRYVSGQLRGAFLGGQLVGGCIAYDRWLPFGATRLYVCGIGGMAIRHDVQRQGIGRAVLEDTLSCARSRGQGMVLLDGIPGFYRRLGYADVVDRTEQVIPCEAILAQPASPYHTRAATLDDAAAILALYQRHFSPYLGHFERSLEQQQRNIESHPPFSPIYLAVDEMGQPHGYLLFDWEHRGAQAAEVTADDWPAALALLQHHAAGVGKLPEPPKEVRWPLPPASAAFYAIADHLPVRSETRVQPDDGWMAQPASLPALFRSLLPLWQERWAKVKAPWQGKLMLEVGDSEGAACGLELEDGALRMLASDPATAPTAHLAPSAFIQLVFGYRPASWVATQPGQSIPAELLPALQVLFPRLQAWIPGTDAF